MTFTTVVGMLLGVFVGLRFTVAALLGVVYLAMFVFAAGGLMVGMTSWSITLGIANVTVAIYLGYFGVTALPRIVIRICRGLRQG